MFTENHIKNFLVENIRCKENEVFFDVDIESDLGCCDDDFHELIEKYAKIFSVDMRNYKWYFHTGEEGNNFGGIFFKSPHERVKRIPVTPEMLLNFANKGSWPLIYPDHQLPKYRYDIWINLLFVITILFFIIKFCIG